MLEMYQSIDHTIRSITPWWWLRINLLTELTIEKSFLYIKLRDRPMTNRSHNKESADNGHMGHKSECLIIIVSLLLLKTTGHKPSFVALKRNIRASLNLVDLLAGDGMNTGRKKNQIPCARSLKGSKLFGHRKLPFRLSQGIPIVSELSNNKETAPIRRIVIRWG